MTNAKLKAIVSLRSNSIYEVVFRYVDEQDARIWTMPSFTVPCDSYDHACAVVGAFNEEVA